MRQLARAGAGEIDAVIGAQPADLTLEIRPLLQKAAALIDEAVPDIDIGDPGPAGGIAVQAVEIQHVGRCLGAAHRGQPDPQHRHAPGLHDRDHLLDLPAVELAPAIIAEIRHAAGCIPRTALGGGDRAGIGNILIGIVSGIGRLRGAVGTQLALLVGLVRLANGDAVTEAQHHHDGVGLLGGQDGLGGGGPVGRIALGLIAQQAGDGLVLADHAHVGLFRIGVVEPIAKPVGHRIAQHQHVAFRGRVPAIRGRRAGIVLARRRLASRRLLLERGKERRVITAEPAKTTLAGLLALRRRRRPAEIEKLRRGRRHDAEQQGGRQRE